MYNKQERLQKILNGLMVRKRDGSYRICSLEERMEYYHCTAFSFAVVNNYQVDLVCSVGKKQYQGAESILPSSPMMAASISKMVTAVGAMKLVQQGILDLDEDVHRYFTDDYILPVANSTLSNRVTLRQIFGHLAGLNVPGFGGYPKGSPLPTLRQVLDGVAPAKTETLRVVRPQNTLVVPDAEYPQGPYSGGGYCLAQKVIQDVTGRHFADVMDELVLQPFGMRNSTFRQSNEPEFKKKFPESLICGYNPTRGGLRLDHYEMVPGGNHEYTELAAGGLWSTAEDLAKFGAHLLRILRDDNDPSLPRTALLEMLRQQKNSANGIGFYIDPTHRPDVFAFSHTGTNDGFLSLASFTSNGCGLAFLFNSNEGMRLYMEFARAIISAYPEFPYDAALLDFKENEKAYFVEPDEE